MLGRDMQRTKVGQMAAVSFYHVNKYYGPQVHAVRDFNLQIADGEFVVMVGPSGCGKTSVLRMLAGLEHISSGEIRLNDRVINNVEAGNRDMAMVFQDYSLFPNMTVEENITFAIRMRKMDKKTCQKRAAEVAEKLGIAQYLKQKARGLSGGECQRISIARALVCEPQVFLYDEPLSNLDSANRTGIRKLIAELHKANPITTLYVTHNQDEAMTLGDRIVVMNEGVIQQIDSPENLYLKPDNVYVSQFVGQDPMNLNLIKIHKEAGSHSLLLSDLRLPIPERKLQNILSAGYEEDEILMGLRAEDVKFSEEEGNDPEWVSLKAEVNHLEVLGAHTIVNLACGEANFNSLKDSDPRLRTIKEGYIQFLPEKMHFFHKESGKALSH